VPEPFQHRLDRVRRPRVQITYDVDTNGAEPIKQLPFVVGVLASLSGNRPEAELGPLRERKFVPVDRDNIDQVLADAKPQLNGLRVANTLAGDGSNLAVNLKFESLADFEPARVAEQIQPLAELLRMRRRLDEVLAKISTNAQLEELLGEVLGNTEKVQALAKAMNIPAAEGGN
jgi:type VI secretion system protein ImpB